ncbi:MAG: ComEC/Rec2 family competence protein [Patescibacteria group bacterium]
MPNPSIFTQVINSYLPEPHASLLNGILFGVSLNTSQEFFQQLKMVGLLHIVVLSGINITLLASIIASFTGFLDKKLSSILTILSIILFVLFVGPDPPIVRAGVMGGLSLFAIIFGRQKSAFYLLFLSGILVLIFKFEWIASISFQLSYGATLGLILFGKIKPKGNKLIDKIKYDISKEIRPSLAAQVFTVPLIFYYFKQISLISPISNLLVSPLIAPLMIFGFITAILGKINLYLGLIPSYICYGILSYIIFVIEFLSKLPFVFLDFN